jgi:hypothetical protein
MEKTVRSSFAAIHPFQIAHEVSNSLGIARREADLRDRKVSRIACSSARGADDACKTLKPRYPAPGLRAAGTELAAAIGAHRRPKDFSSEAK